MGDDIAKIPYLKRLSDATGNTIPCQWQSILLPSACRSWACSIPYREPSYTTLAPFWLCSTPPVCTSESRGAPQNSDRCVLSAKNDANDAAAICEAVQRPNMRFVPHKSPEQIVIQCVHRIRQGYVKSRTALINWIRGLLGEYGFIVRQGICAVGNQLPSLNGDHFSSCLGPRVLHRLACMDRSCSYRRFLYSGCHLRRNLPER